MRIQVTHHHHHHYPQLDEVIERLARLEKLVMSGQTHVNTALANLSTAVAQLGTDIGALAQIIRDNSGGNAALEAAATQIDTAVTALGAAHQAAVDAEAVPPPAPPTT
jgi:predicted glycoside hydrolase/deacetylase ChbG (UPF0249 family)